MTDAAIHRSEKVRQRRTVRSQERLTRTVNYARTADQPRVTARVGLGSPVLNRASNQRRKYFVAIGNLDLAMPALPAFRPGWRLVSGLILLVSLIVIGLLLFGPLFQVKSVTYNGLERLNQADVDAVLDLHNTSIALVAPTDLQARLQSRFPELSSIAIRVGLPNSVTVSVKERQPVLSWKVKDQTYWVDAQGVLFTPHGDGGALLNIQSDDFPPLAPGNPPADAQIAGSTSSVPDPATVIARLDPSSTASLIAIPHQQVDLTLMNAALALSTQMPANSTLVYSRANGLGWTDTRGWKVYFGLDLSNIDVKLSLYQAIVDQLTQKKIKPSVISVEQIYAPFYRLEH
jgi:cell division septal protein FtsQ